MFQVGKYYEFTAWDGNKSSKTFTNRGKVIEVALPLVKISEVPTGEAIINTASLVFISAREVD